MNIYVSINAQGGDGSRAYPLNSVAEAAKLAKPGDTVIVGPGVYREWVDPVTAGTPDARITFVSEEKNAAVITGAEQVKTWVPFEGNTWVARIPNSTFGTYNPYTTLVEGDWFDVIFTTHTGEVYLNDLAMYEADELAQVLNPVIYKGSWRQEETLLRWYTEQDAEADETVIYANFQGKNPNEENVEINVRRNVFYPSAEGIGYITVSGFKLTKAATQWAPPTAYQEGLIGPHWSKGWIIEDCEISDSKCSGISLGKYLQPNNENKWLKKRLKQGTQTERDAICQAQAEGWSKETIGSHIVRRCDIHDCGQTGIVGHLGGVFSIIEDNHIHNINDRQNLGGAEIGGIKMHGAIDVIIRRNHIHHCTRGIWLDWQAQGTRVTRNLFHDNCPPDGTEQTIQLPFGEDLFVEVSHGPTLIDNNIFLSAAAMKIMTQGIALVHNLIGGSFTDVGNGHQNGGINFDSHRYTPYHMPHRTEVAGFMTILHGDARFYNNIFLQQPIREKMVKFAEERSNDKLYTAIVGTHPYDGYPTPEAYFEQFMEADYKIRGGRDKYYDHMPVYTGGNLYLNGAKPCDVERDYVIDNEHKIDLELVCENGEYRLVTNLFEALAENSEIRKNAQMINTETLGEAFEPEQKFENPDGTPITFNTDFFGAHRQVRPCVGPFECSCEAEKVLAKH